TRVPGPPVVSHRLPDALLYRGPRRAMPAPCEAAHLNPGCEIRVPYGPIVRGADGGVPHALSWHLPRQRLCGNSVLAAARRLWLHLLGDERELESVQDQSRANTQAGGDWHARREHAPAIAT